MPETGSIDMKSKNIQPPTQTTGHHRALAVGQTVCTVKDEKGQNCSGHVKQWFTAPPEVRSKAAAGNTIHRCQRCHAIYEGPLQEYLQPKKAAK